MATVNDANTPPQHRRAALAALLGQSIEYYDFYLYGTAAALVLGRLFFPSADPAAGTLAAFATFAAGFLLRPVGAIVFGHLGSRLAGLGGTRAAGASRVLRLDPPARLAGRIADLLADRAAVPADARHRVPHLGLAGTVPVLRRVAGGRVGHPAAAAGDAGVPGGQTGQPALQDAAAGTAAHRVAAAAARRRRRHAHQRRLLPREHLHHHLRHHQARAGQRNRADRPAHHLHHPGITDPVRGQLGHRRNPRLIACLGSALVACWAFPLYALLNTGAPAAIWFGQAVATVCQTGLWAVLPALLARQFPAHLRYTGISLCYQGASLIGGFTPAIATFLLASSNASWPIACLLAGLGVISALGCWFARDDAATGPPAETDRAPTKSAPPAR